MAVTITISITQNSQNVAKNTSNVTVKLTASWTGGSWNHLGTANGSLTVDGTKYSFSNVIINSGKTSSGTQTLITKTLDIAHNADGTKTLSTSASFYTGIDSQGTKAASANKTLTTIPRMSSMSVYNGTLGTALTISVTRQSTSFTHTIEYKCGSASYASIVSKSSNTSINWTPPLELAKYNTTGTSVSVTLRITTYNGSTSVGNSTKTISCAIPASVVPSCTVVVSDPTGYKDTYGSFLKGLSKIKVVITPTLAYDSPIASYKMTIDGVTYTTASFTTGVIKKAGSNMSVSATVKDKRGRSGTNREGTRYYSVTDYIEPVVSKLTVKRCDENGIENDQGTHIQITMSMAVTSLSSNNSASYVLRYKKSTDTDYIEVGLDGLANIYSVTDEKYTFEADTGSSYDIELEVSDNFKTIKRVTSASTAFTLMHFGNDGTSMAIGKVCEEPNLLDIGLPTRFNKPVYGNVMGLNTLPRIPANSDLNEYMAIGCYAVYENADANTIANIPVNMAGRLEVNSSTGEGIRESQYSYIRQRYIPYNSSNATWERDVTRGGNNVWTYGAWWRSSLTPTVSDKVYHEQKILWEGGYYMNETQTVTLSEPVSKQANGIVLVFSRYSDNTIRNYHFNTFFIPKIQVAFSTSSNADKGLGHSFMLTTGENFSVVASKYLYINDTKITGHANNNDTGEASGVTFYNNGFVLRFVYGV